MNLSKPNSAFGIFTNSREMEFALNELNSAGFPEEQISVVAKDAGYQDPLGEAGMSARVRYTTPEGTAVGAIAGSMLGAIGGCLVGLGILAVPGVGPFIAVGTSGTALAGTLAGAGIGVASGGLIEALASLGTFEHRTRICSDRCWSQAEYLVIVYGTDDEVRRAKTIFRKC